MIDFDVIIIGTGSGNTILTPEFDDLQIAIVEKGTFGGTCLNRGCIPSKMLVYVADVLTELGRSRELGITAGNYSEIGRKYRSGYSTELIRSPLQVNRIGTASQMFRCLMAKLHLSQIMK